MFTMFSISDEQRQKCLDLTGRSRESFQEDIQNIREWLDLQHHLPKLEISKILLYNYY